MSLLDRLLGRSKQEAARAVDRPAASVADQNNTPGTAPSSPTGIAAQHPSSLPSNVGPSGAEPVITLRRARPPPPGVLEIRARLERATSSSDGGTRFSHNAKSEALDEPSVQRHPPPPASRLPSALTEAGEGAVVPRSREAPRDEAARALPTLAGGPSPSLLAPPWGPVMPPTSEIEGSRSTRSDAVGLSSIGTLWAVSAPGATSKAVLTEESRREPEELASRQSQEGWLDDVLDSLDSSFDAIQDAHPSGDGTAIDGTTIDRTMKDGRRPFDEAVGAQPDDAETVQNLFLDIASNYLRPVHHFVAELRKGPTRAEWIPIARPALENIRRAAIDVGLDDLAPALEHILENLDALETRGETVLRGEARDRVLDQYSALTQIAPRTFAIDPLADSSRSLVVHALLSSIPGVGKVTIDRLFRVGLFAVELITMATPEDLTLTTGIRRELSEVIVDRFRTYHQEVAGKSPDTIRRTALEELGTVLHRLEETNAAYEAAASRHASEEKLRARQMRHALLNKTHLLLGKMGEVALANELERMPFERRMEQLLRFITNA